MPKAGAFSGALYRAEAGIFDALWHYRTYSQTGYLMIMTNAFDGQEARGLAAVHRSQRRHLFAVLQRYTRHRELRESLRPTNALRYNHPTLIGKEGEAYLLPLLLRLHMLCRGLQIESGS